MDDRTSILYICDRKKCGETCLNSECKYTTDINHAVNFKIYRDKGIYFVEGGWSKETEVNE